MDEREKILVEQCKVGNRQAMSKLYELYYRPMFNTAYRIVNDFHFAEDIMHEAFIKAFEHIRSFRGDASFGAWLKRIIINESLQWIKKYGNFNTGEDETKYDMPYNDEDPELPGAGPQELLQAMRGLKDNYRTILSLYYMEGYDYAEISQILGISYQNARTMLSRAKAALRKLLDENKKR
jgi:RNA polymerase sigma-70 factor (ECF subfamily)